MSTRPEPQIPSGSVAPIVEYSKWRSPEGGAGGARRREVALAVGDDDLGVGPDIDQHPDARAIGEVDRDEVGGRVGSHMAGDQGRAHHPAIRIHQQPGLVGAPTEPRRRRASVEHGPFGQRLVRELADRSDVDTKEQVAHRAVADDDRLVHLVAIDPQLAVEIAQLVVQRAAHRESHGPGEVLLVRDAGHHVAAAEALRVLERARRQDGASQQVDQLDHDGRRPDVDGEAQDVLAAKVDRLAGIADREIVGGDDGIQPGRGVAGRAEDPDLAADDRKLDVIIDGLDDRLAGEPERPPEVELGLGARREVVGALADLDDALAAAAGATARCRHCGRDLVRIVEE